MQLTWSLQLPPPSQTVLEKWIVLHSIPLKNYIFSVCDGQNRTIPCDVWTIYWQHKIIVSKKQWNHNTASSGNLVSCLITFKPYMFIIFHIGKSKILYILIIDIYFKLWLCFFTACTTVFKFLSYSISHPHTFTAVHWVYTFDCACHIIL